MGEARILASKICKTVGFHRPFPSLFYFPGLISKPYHDSQSFPFLGLLQKNYNVIRKEYEDNKDRYKVNDWQEGEDEHKLEAGEWQWLAYMKKGQKNKGFSEIFPQTSKILGEIEDLCSEVPFSYAYYSVMKPKTSIPHHFGPCNIRLRCHFPLIVPEDCFMRVAGNPQHWEEGKLIVFDDTYEHEAANFGETGERVVLLFDIWHPELAQPERTAIVEMFKNMEKKIHEKVKIEKSATTEA